MHFTRPDGHWVSDDIADLYRKFGFETLGPDEAPKWMLRQSR